MWNNMNDLECGWWDVKGTPSIPWPDLSHRWVQRCCAEKVTCNSKVLKRALMPKSRRNKETEVQYTWKTMSENCSCGPQEHMSQEGTLRRMSISYLLLGNKRPQTGIQV